MISDEVLVADVIAEYVRSFVGQVVDPNLPGGSLTAVDVRAVAVRLDLGDRNIPPSIAADEFARTGGVVDFLLDKPPKIFVGPTIITYVDKTTHPPTFVMQHVFV